MMRRYYDNARAVLEHHGGTVEKFIGDAVMAVFGMPVATEDDALRAVRAAVELRDAVQDLGLEARIGVNTGEVVAVEGDTLVTGDAVNVAARLEQSAASGDVLLGETTAKLERDAVEIVAKAWRIGSEEDIGDQICLDLAEAHARAMHGEPAAARSSLGSARTKAAGTRMTLMNNDIDVAEGEVEMMAGNRARAMALAERLEAQARELGLPRYAEALRRTVVSARGD